ncbi:Single-stranded DNA-binding protein 3 [Myotis davidii]|uniref:Single-stranded DNA-binding protein 3 n=1 Tax=Myotis davidii TaxID=225400 RepID=L5LKH6_MYODS|nr:Single-stranded DNA-binding protein 3 [Myotis davidii]
MGKKHHVGRTTWVFAFVVVIPYSSSSPGTYVGPPGGGGPPGTPIMPSPADSTNSSDNIYTMINPVPPGGSRSNFPMGPGSDGPMGGMGGMEPHHMNGSLEIAGTRVEGFGGPSTKRGQETERDSFLLPGSGDIDGLPKAPRTDTPPCAPPPPLPPESLSPSPAGSPQGRGSPLLSPQNSPNNISGISNPPGTPRDDGELGGNFLHSFQNDNSSAALCLTPRQESQLQPVAVFSKHDDECVTLLFSETLREPALRAGRCQKLCKKK